MNTTITNATEYRNLPLALLTESKTNPRRTFEDDSLKELAESIRTQGILSPLLVRPITEQGFEIVFGARRYRAAQMAEAATVPVRIKNLTDAEALEAQLIENLQRRDVHPMEEANGFRALLELGRAEVQHRANRSQNGQIARVCGWQVEADRACSRCGRSLLPRGDRRRPCALAGEAPARPAGTGARSLLQRGLEQRRAEGEAHPSPCPQSPVLD